VALRELDRPVRVDERDAGHGIVLHVDELLLLGLLLGRRHLVEVEVATERGDEEGEDEDPDAAHPFLRRHHTAMPMITSSSGRRMTERWKSRVPWLGVKSARDARTERLPIETSSSWPTSQPTAFRKRSPFVRDCVNDWLSAKRGVPMTTRRASSGAFWPSA